MERRIYRLCLKQTHESPHLRREGVQSTETVFGGPPGLLRIAASAVVDAGTNYGGSYPGDPTKQEICALAHFGHEKGLMLELSTIQGFIEQDFIGSGIEHRVAAHREKNRVIKIYDPREIDEQTGETFYKPAALLFDYLTDHLLSNHLFGDDLCLEGFYEDQGNLHLVISQPFVRGKHPSWSQLVDLMQAQGLEHESPGTTKAKFWVDAGDAGRVLVTDVHEDNVIVMASGRGHPIDVHFSFPSRQARIEALTTLGICHEQITTSVPSPPR